ncbi:endonuclease, partial [Firmicutes bacterium AF36-3BH]
MKMKEIWKDIENYKGIYQCSNFGHIRSLDRNIKRKN